MDPFDSAMLDDGELTFEALLNNNFPDNLDFERELEENAQNFEKVIFGSSQEVVGNIFDVLGGEDAEQLLQSIKTEKESFEEEEEEEPILVQCANCDEIFTNESFHLHECQYTDNKEKILAEVIQEDPNESEFQKLRRSTMEMIEFNQSKIRKLLDIVNPPPVQQPKDDKAKQSNFECFVCTRKFVHESGLYRHYDKHIGEILPPSPQKSNKLHSVILCAFCGETFTMEQDLWSHLQKLHYEVHENETFIKFHEKELVFEITDKDSKEPKAKKQKMDSSEVRVAARNFPIEQFVRTIYVRNLYHCEYCSSTFANSKSLLLHTSKHEPGASFQCNYCHIQGLSLKDLVIHRHDDCVFYKDYRNNISEIPCLWTCNVCDEECLGVEQLILHRHNNFHFFPRIEHKSTQVLFTCELCSICYETATQLVGHLTDKHLKKPRISAVPETSTRVQKSPTAVRKGGGHQTSTRPRQYLCEICGKSYTQSSHLWQHLRFHQGIKPFECPHPGCGRKFTIRPDLNDHIRKCHTGERPYECTICGKRFLTGSVFYQHRLIHRGERRYGCEECGKRFYRADALKNHQLIHTGQKPFKCWVDGCDKSFRQRGDRDKHVKARHKDAPPMPSPPKKRMKVQSFGRGRTKNNMSLYSAKPPTSDING